MVFLPLLLLAYASLFFAGLIDNARGPLLGDLKTTFALSNSLASLFFSVGLFASMPGTLLAGQALRRWPVIRCLQWSIGTFVLGYVLIGWGPSYVVVLCGSALYGLGMGAHHVMLNVLIAQATPLATRARHMSGVHVMYGLASLLAPIAVVALRPVVAHWQQIFFVLVLGCVAVLLVTVLLPPTLRTPVAPRPTASLPLWRVLASATCRYYSLVLGLYVTAELAIVFWLVLYIASLGRYSAAESALYLTYHFLAMTASRIAGGLWLKSHHDNRWVLILSAGGGAICVILGLYVHPLWLPLGAAPAGLFFPVAFAALSQEMPGEFEAATGWVLCVVFACIGVGQIVMGWIGDHFSLATAMHFPALLLGLVVLALALRRFPKRS